MKQRTNTSNNAVSTSPVVFELRSTVCCCTAAAKGVRRGAEREAAERQIKCERRRTSSHRAGGGGGSAEVKHILPSHHRGLGASSSWIARGVGCREALPRRESSSSSIDSRTHSDAGAGGGAVAWRRERERVGMRLPALHLDAPWRSCAKAIVHSREQRQTKQMQMQLKSRRRREARCKVT